ncbi:MAG: tetratricopeptide repeat protein [Saccharospirillaceae bacterium]|nr:tetratricopeptide repeat protein [Pseudomonadales bacterium]NRB79661.1 tetratricopeptide repeat protein [Saccharospirillaceae bacterium]
MRFNHLILRLCAAISLIFFSLEVSAESEEAINRDQLAAIENAFTNRQFEKSWLMASALQERFEGLTEFDFLFARVAIENKEYELAIFALNRVLIDEPNNYRIHLEMGRALFFNNNLTQSKNHFNFVLESTPPKVVVQKINQYISAINNTIKQRGIKKTKSISLHVGTTDNVNSAPNSLTLTPLHNRIGLSQLTDESEKRNDIFINLIGSIGIQKPINNSSSFKTSATLNLKQGNDSAGINDSVNLSGAVSYTKTFNKFTFSPFSQLSLNNSNHDFSGLGLILGIGSPYKITQKIFSNSTFSFALNTDGDINISNLNSTLSNSIIYSLKKHQHSLTLILMQFNLEDKDQAHNAFSALNIGYSLNSSFTNKISNTFSASYMSKNYNSQDPLFLDPDNLSEAITRADNQVIISNQFNFVRNKKQQYFAKLNALQQISNIEVYNLVKFDISFGLNFQF